MMTQVKKWTKIIESLLIFAKAFENVRETLGRYFSNVYNESKKMASLYKTGSYFGHKMSNLARIYDNERKTVRNY